MMKLIASSLSFGLGYFMGVVTVVMMLEAERDGHGYHFTDEHSIYD